ncbi:hypothetical protein [Tsuneonella rigui]|uniref:hypothetical protein n=1 Tax=Tsuneonella rigui TaxID=1708790 RepID=UPI000F7E2A0A|nr:hypothetical protein [Tsuneonella rigui]
MKKLAAIAAAAALFLPATAQAEEMSPAAVQAAVRYSLPHLLSGVRASCGPKLSANGYLATQGDALLARFSQGSEAAWPAAKTALMQLGAKEEKGMGAMLGQMPDSALKPFVDATISTMVATKLKPENCGDVERGLELLAPLPPENIAGLVGFVIEMAERDDKKKDAKGG